MGYILKQACEADTLHQKVVATTLNHTDGTKNVKAHHESRRGHQTLRVSTIFAPHRLQLPKHNRAGLEE